MASAQLLVMLISATTVVVAEVWPSQEVPQLCLQGPELWCQDQETAALCAREEYCMRIWQNAPKLNAPGDENPVESSLGIMKLKCKCCVKIMTTLKLLVGEDPDYEAINSALHEVCRSIGRIMKGLCRIMVKRYKDKILEALQNDQDPQEFCEERKMCHKNPSNTGVMVPPDFLEVPEQCLQGPRLWCQNWEMASLCMKEEYCMDVWQNMSLELEEASEEELEKKKKKKKSKKKKPKKEKKKKHPAKPSVKCTTCTQILGTLKDMIGKDADDDTINDAISAVCDDLDEAAATECSGIMELYKDQVIDALKNDEDPKEFCAQINMCGGEAEPSSEPETMAFAPTATNSCTICQTFTRQVTTKLNDDLVASDFERILEKKCEEHFGGSSECKEFISTYGAKMKQVLNKPLDHVTTCLEIKACRPEVQATMMGSDSDCQKGPQHWCSSVEVAIRCNALPFCVNTWGF